MGRADSESRKQQHRRIRHHHAWRGAGRTHQGDVCFPRQEPVGLESVLFVLDALSTSRARRMEKDYANADEPGGLWRSLPRNRPSESSFAKMGRRSRSVVSRLLHDRGKGEDGLPRFRFAKPHPLDRKRFRNDNCRFRGCTGMKK